MSTPFRDGVSTGCMIAFLIFGALLLVGKCAQWMGVE